MFLRDGPAFLEEFLSEGPGGCEAATDVDGEGDGADDGGEEDGGADDDGEDDGGGEAVQDEGQSMSEAEVEADSKWQGTVMIIAEDVIEDIRDEKERKRGDALDCEEWAEYQCSEYSDSDDSFFDAADYKGAIEFTCDGYSETLALKLSWHRYWDWRVHRKYIQGSRSTKFQLRL